MAKFALMIFLFYQGAGSLTPELANTRNAGLYDKSKCEEQAAMETKRLTLGAGDAARWQFATCVQVLP